MNDNWLTKDQDIRFAHRVLRKHTSADGERDKIRIFAVEDGELKTHLPIWFKELTRHYCQRYGKKQGTSIAEKVMVSLMLEHETIH